MEESAPRTLGQRSSSQSQRINHLSGEGVNHLKAFRGSAHSKQDLKRGEQRGEESNQMETQEVCPLMMRVWLVMVVEPHADAHSRVRGHGPQAEGSNERVEGKDRGRALPRCPGGWARLSRILNACRSLFLQFTILLWGSPSLKMTEKQRQQERRKIDHTDRKVADQPYADVTKLKTAQIDLLATAALATIYCGCL